MALRSRMSPRKFPSPSIFTFSISPVLCLPAVLASLLFRIRCRRLAKDSIWKNSEMESPFYFSLKPADLVFQKGCSAAIILGVCQVSSSALLLFSSIDSSGWDYLTLLHSPATLLSECCPVDDVESSWTRTGTVVSGESASLLMPVSSSTDQFLSGLEAQAYYVPQ